LRANETSSEAKLWQVIRNRQLGGLKFARQVAIDPYYADFVCRELKLVVEIDGGTHGTTEEVADDEARAEFLESRGYRIFRVLNDDVFHNIDGVLETLLAFARMGR
jgi:very-short-patch-repair endonuclease